MDLMNMPVTLVVKAPNQRVEDQTVECMLGWTVKKLKTHLAQVYPSQPKENQQKLIYSGKLLHDNLVLKDVLRQYDDSPTHTLHLVCLHGADSGMQQSQQTTSTAESLTQNSPSNQSLPAPTSSDGGLRHRHNTAANAQMFFQQFQEANARMMSAMPPGGMMQYSPQQIMWMQHMYTQQMAFAMQQYQQHIAQQQQQQIPVASEFPAQNQNAPNNNQPANQPRPANQPEAVRMNAQGGPLMDDDEDEMGNRDWLDWIYTLCRVGVLLSIVYFYSSFSRFFMVFGFFVMIYLYQAGFFRLRRRQVRPNQPAPEPANQQNNNQNQAADENADAEGSTEELAAEPPVEPPQPSGLAVAWSFFTTFFSSLIPQQPGAVNAN